MLRKIYFFLKKEPGYFWLLFASLAIYALLHWAVRPYEKKSFPILSTKIASFQADENGRNREGNREKTFPEFAQKNPVTAMLFQWVTLLIIFLFSIGLIVDALFFSRPLFRQKFSIATGPPVHGAIWSFALLFKVVVLLLAWGIILSLVLGVCQAIFPKWFSDHHSMIAHTFLLDVLGFYFIVRFIQQGGSSWQDLGFHLPRKDFFREVGAGLLGYVGVLPLFIMTAVLLLGLADLFHYEPPPHPLVNVFIENEKRAPLLILASIFLGVIVGPVFEEIFFRGFCYPIFKNLWGKFWGMSLSAAFFAGIHHTGFVFWPIFVLGIALAYVYEKRGSLVASITLHITHNVLFISYFFIAKQMIAIRVS